MLEGVIGGNLGWIDESCIVPGKECLPGDGDGLGLGADNATLEIGCQELKGIVVLAGEDVSETWGIELGGYVEWDVGPTDAGHVVCEDFVDHRWAQIRGPDTKVCAEPLITDDLGILVERRKWSDTRKYIFEPAELLGIEDGNHDSSEFTVIIIGDLGVVVAVRQLQYIGTLGKYILGNAGADIATWLVKVRRY